ncbi:hypothetical protein R80B4_02839 [Fibrobacteres bacterium R8-0-B4]
MKKCLILLSITFICVYCGYAQVRKEYCDDSNCWYQLLLRRWREGADGQGQAPIDSIVKQRILRSLATNNISSLERHKKVVDLGRYRGLAISLFDNDLRYECMMPCKNCSIDYYYFRFDGIAIKMVREYYKIDVDTKTICQGLWNVFIDSGYILVGVTGLPDNERIVFLISIVTGEVLSTYKG